MNAQVNEVNAEKDKLQEKIKQLESSQRDMEEDQA